MKSKFGSFNFGSVEVLSREEEAKVKGGAYGSLGGGGSASSCSAYCVTGGGWFSSGTSTYLFQTSMGNCDTCTQHLQSRCFGRLDPGPCRAA